MGIVTGTTVTLDQSIIESNAKKYVGYITRCDNSYYYDGTWSPTSATGIGVSVSNSILSVWNNNSSTSDISKSFTWTSSKLSNCTKTFTVVAKGKEEEPYKVMIDIQITFDINYVRPGECTNTSGTPVDLTVYVTCNEDSNIKHRFIHPVLPPMYSGGSSSGNFKTTATSLSGNVEISLAHGGQNMVVLRNSIAIEAGSGDNSGSKSFDGGDGYLCNIVGQKYYEYSNMSASQTWRHNDMNNSTILIDIYIG